MPTIYRSKPVLQPFRYPSSLSSGVVLTQSRLQLKPQALPQYNSDPSGDSSLRSKLYSLLQYLQSVTSRIYADPDFTQAKVFRFAAPIAVFFAVLTTIAVLSRSFDVEDWLGTVTDLCMLVSLLVMIVVLVIGGALATLWATIWTVAMCIRLFVEKDFESGRRATVGSLGQVMGGMF